MTSPLLELQGTWEEIVAQSAKLAGRRIRVIVLPEEPLPSSKESFRQAWHEVKTGKTRPISELWEGLDTE
ncbi:hypothetical protein [Kamptonema formosum]|uniref:hypothetical protein n=1 Tax=Kamptonema formosum TaxID=331992 RepID=UPI0003492F98|nr:hypothetical protein [Oscillatoria sp. PCC 10802]